MKLVALIAIVIARLAAAYLAALINFVMARLNFVMARLAVWLGPS
jgi:hypothetical protein